VVPIQVTRVEAKSVFENEVEDPPLQLNSERAERYLELKRCRAERRKRLEEMEKTRTERTIKKEYIRHIMCQHMKKSMQMLETNSRGPVEDPEPFEDFDLFMYRMTAPDFKDRVKQLENKLLHPVRGLDDLSA